MALHIYPVTIRTVSPFIQCLLSRPTTENRSAPTLIYFHGFNGSRNQIFQEKYIEFAEAIQAIGYNLLSVDLRGHGDRRDDRKSHALDNVLKLMKHPQKNPFDGAIADIEKVVQFLVEKKICLPHQIAVSGLSWGAMHALYALKLSHHIRCCIALLPVGKITNMIEFKRMGNDPLIKKYDPINYVSRIAPKPLLMISGEKDTRIDPLYAGKLYEKLYTEYKAANAGDKLVYKMLLNVGHHYDSRMTEMTVHWLKEHLVADPSSKSAMGEDDESMPNIF